ncbi:DUF3500 domain-containing protein [Nocardia sp. NPDC057455]|uniref:DUF3500 domain-containing protein n=1 Tax=Nocardia sp. NPDC057455 TaxID=3346138 RepID=UPI00366F0346
MTVLPRPGGQYLVGETVLHLVDASRQDPFYADRQRELMVSVFYPTTDVVKYPRAHYISKTLIPDLEKRSGVGLPGLLTNSYTDAPALAGAAFPVVLYSSGAGDTRVYGTGLAEDLASRGYDDIDLRAESGSGYTAADHAAMAISFLPKGLAARDLDPEQRHVLRQLISLFTGRAPRALADAHAAHYEADHVLDEVYFGWAGGLESGEPHYYRIQGPDLLIEYDNTQRHANHAHSVWRNPRSDFGLDSLAEHRRRSTH